ncbi:uncharacterized protein LOC118434712 [Folsomia candida]|uniref:uncharacterized protein LOC118434712 n=1 Tax=Folsomia candida TaxID=158441 RepID=UPI001604F8A5|nr:uncharacterized protein LOC118434712 [Folsomia candida]
MIINEGYNGYYHQEPDNGYIEQEPSVDIGQYYEQYYDHATSPPNINNYYHHPLNKMQYPVVTKYPQEPQANTDNIKIYKENQSNKPATRNQKSPPDQDQPPQKRPGNSNPLPMPTVEQSPSHHGGGGGGGVKGGWGSGHDDWGPSEIWNAMKTYWKKSDSKSTAQKVFEVSIGILSFLAFGGYLLMLIYQVFAVTTAVPFFPLLSSTVPQNPTLFGLLFGRSIESDNGVYRFNPNELVNGKYIEELERIVKTAMDKVRLQWSGFVVGEMHK